MCVFVTHVYVHVDICYITKEESTTHIYTNKILKQLEQRLKNNHATADTTHTNGAKSIHSTDYSTLIRGWLDTGIYTFYIYIYYTEWEHDKSAGLITRDLTRAVTPCLALSHSIPTHPAISTRVHGAVAKNGQ